MGDGVEKGILRVRGPVSGNEVAVPLETTTWDPVERIKTPTDQLAHLQAAFEENEPALIVAALRDIARARGIAEIVNAAGLSRGEVFEACRRGGKPTLETLMGVAKAFGSRLTIKRLKPAEKARKTQLRVKSPVRRSAA